MTNSGVSWRRPGVMSRRWACDGGNRPGGVGDRGQIKKFVKTMRRYRTIEIQAGDHVITAADPLPADAHTALDAIRARQV